MRKELFALLTVISILFMACHEDKGNYEYSTINKITISNIEEEYTVKAQYVIEPIITPELRFSGEPITDLAYEWKINHEVVSTEPTLTEPINLPVANDYYAILTVTDTITGNRFFKDFRVNVIASYTNGLAVLSEREDGSSMLSFQPRGRDVSTDQFVLNVFEAVNPDFGSLGSKPLEVGYRFSPTGWYILSEEGDKNITALEPNTLVIKSWTNASEIDNYSGSFRPTMMDLGVGLIPVLSEGDIFIYDKYRTNLMFRSKVEGKKFSWVGNAWPNLLYSYLLIGYDTVAEEFTIMRQDLGNSYSYTTAYPWYEEYEFALGDGEEPVSTKGLDYYASSLMLDGGRKTITGKLEHGYQYSGALRFIFTDAAKNAHFLSYDAFYKQYIGGKPYEYKAISDTYGMRIEKVVPGLIKENTVVTAARLSHYWFFANDRNISRHFDQAGAHVVEGSLPAEVKGKITAMLVSGQMARTNGEGDPLNNEHKLYVAVYDDSSSEEYKGGVAVLNINPVAEGYGMFDLMEYYPNVAGRIVSMFIKEF